MSQLPPLRGTPAQIKWAMTIRTNTLSILGDLPDGLAEILDKVVDSTWFIGNRDKISNDRVSPDYKEPAPHQIAGGPPPPGHTPDLPMQGEGRPHDAELFAASVCRYPVLAEVTLLALLARCYKGEIRDKLKHAATRKFTAAQEVVKVSVDRDVDGIRRIIASLDKPSPLT